MVTAVQYHREFLCIITKIECSYSKKARGQLTATSEISFRFEDLTEDVQERSVLTTISDSAGDEVATVNCIWRIKKKHVKGN